MGRPMEPHQSPSYPASPPVVGDDPTVPFDFRTTTLPVAPPPPAPVGRRARRWPAAVVAAVVAALLFGVGGYVLGDRTDDDELADLEAAADVDGENIEDLEDALREAEEQAAETQVVDPFEDLFGELGIDPALLEEILGEFDPTIFEDLENLENLEDLFPTEPGTGAGIFDDDVPLTEVPGADAGSVVEDDGVSVQSVQVGQSFGTPRVVGRLVDSVGGRSMEVSVTLFEGDQLIGVAHGNLDTTEAGEVVTVELFTDDQVVGATRYEFQVDRILD